MDNNKTHKFGFIKLVIIVASVTLIISFAIGIKFVHDNKEMFTTKIKESAIIKPEN